MRLIKATESIAEGASCEIGGLTSSDGIAEGIFFEPTLLRDCSNGMIIVQTQINAPIICAFSIKGVEEFCNEVNANQFGTGIRIFTKNERIYDIV